MTDPLELLNLTRSGVARVDERGHVLEANDAFRASVGREGDRVDEAAAAAVAAFLRGSDEVGELELEAPAAGVRLARLARARDGVSALIEVPELDEAARRELDRLRRLRTLARLVDGIAHDFNNVFGAIVGYADHLASLVDDADRIVVTQLQSSALTASQLLQAMAEFLVAGPRDRDVVDLGELLERVHRLTGKAAIRSGVEVAITVDEGVPAARCDRVELAHFVLQLIVHVVEHAPEGATISVAVSSAPGDASRVRLVVRAPIPTDDVISRMLERPEHGLLTPIGQFRGDGEAFARSILALRLGGSEIDVRPEGTMVAGLEIVLDLPIATSEPSRGGG